MARTTGLPVAVPPRKVSIDLPAEQSGVLKHESGARLEVPIGAATSPVSVSISEVGPPPSPLKIGRVFEFSLEEGALLEPVVIHMPFEIEQGPDSTGVVALRWDGEKDVWLEADSDVDLSSRMVAVTVSELGLFSTGEDDGYTVGEGPYSSERGGSLVWEHRTMDSDVTSIVEAGGVLYVAGCSGDGSLYALDAATGSSLWERSTRGQTENCVPASPIVADGVVYIVSKCRDCDMGLFGGVLVTLDVTALDAATGDVMWRNDRVALEFTKAVVSDGRVYLASPEGGVTALDAATGDPLWQHAPEARFSSPRFESPVVSGEMVFGIADDDHMYALRADTGDLVWRYETVGGATAPIVVDRGTVYVTLPDGRLDGLNASTGELLWQYEMGGDTMVTPTVSGGVVYVVSENEHVHALASGTGELLWRYKTGYSVLTPPVVFGDKLYVVSWEEGYLYSLDASTGAFRWRYRTGFIRQRPVVSGGIVYLGSEGWSGLSKSGLYALDAATGVRYWQYDGVVAPVVTDGLVYVRTTYDGGPARVHALGAGVREGAQTAIWQYEAGSIGPPAVASGVVSMIDWNGQVWTVSAVDADTGVPRWIYELGDTGGTGIPVVASGTTMCVVEGNFVLGLDAGTGDVLWQFDTEGAEFESEAPPVASEGVFYLASTRGSVYALDANTGDLTWRIDADDTVPSSTVESDGVVYFASWNIVYAVDAITGDLLWQYDPGAFVSAQPVVSDGVAYISLEFIHLNALDAVTGDLQWRFEGLENRYLSLPVGSGRTVIVAARDELHETSVVYALDAGNGEAVWEEKIRGIVWDAPAVSDGAVFVTTVDGKLYSLDAGTAATHWRVDMADDVSTSPVVSDGRVFVVSRNGHVYTWDAHAKDLLWRYDTGSSVNTSLVVSDGTVYVPGILYLYALDVDPAANSDEH